MSKSYSVSRCCITQADTILLEFLLSLQEKLTDSQWHLVDDMTGDIIIIDTDKEPGRKLYEKLTVEKSDKIIIVLTSNTSLINPVNLLNKPLRSSDFISLIKDLLYEHPDIGKQVNSRQRAYADKPTTRKSTLDKRNAVGIHIKRPTIKRLYNLLTENINDYKNPIKITYLGVCLYINFSYKRFYCDHELLGLSFLFKTNIKDLQITELSEPELNYIENEFIFNSLNELLWCCTLFGSSGELCDKIDERTLLRLHRWPNFKSLTHLSIHLRLSAYMTKNTASLSNIATFTNVLPETVINFINACQLLGYLSIVTTKNDIITEEFKSNHEVIDLFEILRNRFNLDTLAQHAVYLY